MGNLVRGGDESDVGDPGVLPRIYALGVAARVMTLSAAGVGSCDFWLDVSAADHDALRWATRDWPSLVVEAQVPHLFIYSDSDVWFPAREIERAALIIRTGGKADSPEGVITLSRQLGDRLKSKLHFFEGSLHCAHFQRYAEETLHALRAKRAVAALYTLRIFAKKIAVEPFFSHMQCEKGLNAS